MSQPTIAPPGGPLQFPFGPLLLVALPNSGTTAGGNTVQLIGLGLGGATSVLFGATPGTILAGDPLGLTLSVAAPAHAAGSVPVTVVTGSGASNPVSYTYSAPVPPAPPTAVSINPAAGPVAGSSPFVINGTHLTGASVTLGGVAATMVGADPTGTLLIGISPAGTTAGNVPVVVTTASGTATVPGGYTYV